MSESKADDHPPSKFECGDMIRTPIEVCEAGVAKVVGREWGPDNRFLNSGSWVYVVRFYEKDPRPGVSHSWPTNRTFLATEEEIEKWSE